MGVWAASMCIAIAGCAAAAAPAAASFGLSSFAASFNQAPLAGAEAETLGPPDLQAGSHPYQFTVALTFNASADAKGETLPEGAAKDIQIELPPGVIGTASAIPTCPTAVFEQGGLGGNPCPADTRIGQATVKALLFGSVHTIRSFLINLAPPPGVPAQFGMTTLTPITLEGTVRPNDGGLTILLPNLPEPLPVFSVSIAIWGVPADSRHEAAREGPSGAPVEPLLTMPSSCGQPLTTRIVMNSWEDPNEQVQASVRTEDAEGTPSGLLGCDRLKFDPTIAIQPESRAADTPTGLAIDLKTPYNDEPEGIAEAGVKNIAIALPAGLSLNPATASGLVGCSAAQLGLGEATKPACPDAAKLGTLSVQTPLLGATATGAIYLAQAPNQLFDDTLEAYVATEDGLLKLPARLSVQSESGQLTLTLEDIPQLPFTDMRLDLFGGPRALLANSPVCGTFSSTAELTPYSAPQTGSPAVRSSSFMIDEGCGEGFAPSFTAGSTSSQAGQDTDVELQIDRDDGQQFLRGLDIALPPGLVARLGSVTPCSEAQIAATACPEASRVGTVTIGAGAGPAPVQLEGSIYLTGPYAREPFGIVMVAAAAVGQFNLGTVVVRGGVAVNLAEASLSIATDPFPTSLQGIPLRVKSVELSIDRAGFMINPTACTQEAIDGNVTSVAGAGFEVAAQFRVSGCALLPFAPKVTASSGAPPTRARGVGLNVTIARPAGPEADIRTAVFKLPKQLRARLGTVQHTCRAAVFAANPAQCGADAVVGSGTVNTVLPTPLTGPIYLVAGAGLLPRLKIVLQGDGVSDLVEGVVHVAKTRVVTATFEGLPDVPDESVHISLPEGPNSMFGSSRDTCTSDPSIGYAITGYNGIVAKGAAKLAVESGCSHAHAARRRARHARR